MPEKPSDQKDVADMLESMAEKLRADRAPVGERQAVTVEHGLDDAPRISAVDLVEDRDAITVTIETHNAEPSSVHVSILEGRLLIGVGDGPRASRRDLALPQPVDEDSAVATFRNGILDVVLPLRRRAE